MNYYEEYFTTESLVANNTITLTIGSAVTTQCITYIAYSKDKTNWTSITPTSGTDTISITLNANEKAYWKGDALALARSYGGLQNQSNFSSTGNYKIYGNIASLLYADSFAGKFYFPEASSTWNYRNFQKLFYQNTYLVDAKGLIFPFKKYPNNCCANMFEKCHIVNTPQMKLDNTNHGNYALENMFRDCTSLVDASSIEINGSINSNGIDQMFRGCSLLTKPPKIGDITTSGSASLQLFYSGCTNLNYIVNLDPNPDTSRYTNWVQNVSATGTFIKHPDAIWVEGISGIPSGWTVKNMNPQTQTIDYSKVTAAYVKGNHSLSAIYSRGNVLLWGSLPVIDYSKKYLTFECVSDGTLIWKCNNSSCTISYSKNDGAWTSWTSSSDGNSISLNTGDILRLKGNNATYYGYGSSTNRSYFASTSTGKFNLYGNIMSLIYGDDFIDNISLSSSKTSHFSSLFSSLKIIDAENCILPALTLYSESYYSLFSNCNLLEKAPKLPATTLGQACYNYMFSGCSSLVNAPEILATTLATYCCSLMFLECTSLVTGPTLLASTGANQCYSQMFLGCSKLNYVKCLLDTHDTSYTTNWFNGVPASGTFVKKSGVSWTRSTSGIPSGWTVEEVTS